MAISLCPNDELFGRFYIGLKKRQQVALGKIFSAIEHDNYRHSNLANGDKASYTSYKYKVLLNEIKAEVETECRPGISAFKIPYAPVDAHPLDECYVFFEIYGQFDSNCCLTPIIICHKDDYSQTVKKIMHHYRK